ncbi:ABC transporter ATP-binding protein [Cyclobacterium marinum]|uniref:ABC transporter ATP-binding protein n=1 Tax=Cyclobacterium marinum TaxID=104 RepID=UPI0011EF27E5|nr:ABC transporter ATP-binding protein [Cyclobacterium marinum]MBI0399408.1 ABC transporter ATP-binding protein [Cyclobacterium marinum]
MSYLNIEGLTKIFDGELKALDSLSLSINKAERWSIIGSSGSGKSTLLKLIAGMEVQNEGQVYLEGEKILNPEQKLVAGYDELQLVKQDNGLFPLSTVAENISRPLLQYDKAYAKARLEALLQVFGLVEKRDSYPRQLSGGQQQKVAIARALSLEPQVLLLDEPFSSLDSLQKRGLLDELNLIFKELEITVIMVTHDIQDALLLTENLCVLSEGKLLRQGKVKDIYKNPQTAYVAGFFGPLNRLPGKPNLYLRPSSIKHSTSAGMLKGSILLKRYFPEYDLLTVKVSEEHPAWQLIRYERDLSEGQTIFMNWEEEDVLALEEK